jgi:cobalt transporter subunit CbtB
MSVHQSTSPVASSVAATRTNAVLQAAMAILLGVFIIGAVSFSHIDVVHNAAHDTRHSNGFPCH